MNTYYSNGKRKYAELSYENKYLLDPKYMTKRDMQHYYRYYNMTKNRSQFKKVVCIVFCICFFSYVFIDFNLKTKIIQLRDRFDFMARVDAEYNITQAYFVDTPGCRMPFFNVTDNTIVQYMFKPANYTCKKALTRTSDVGSLLWLNMNDEEILDRYNVSDLKQTRCYYNEIKRTTDKENQLKKEVFIQLEPNKPIQIADGIEFIRVQCLNSDRDIFYTDVHFFAVEKSEKRSTPQFKQIVNLTKATNATTQRFSTFDSVSFGKTGKLKKIRTTAATYTPDKVSVMILGIDSVSHLNFLRQMKQTAAFIQKQLSHVELWGYNKVGDNTYPNLVTVLTGLDETELNISCLAPYKNVNYDRCAFIWKKFKKAGYKTVYAEDVAGLGLFNYYRPGFKQQPTDYYLRPALQEMEEHISYMANGNVELCKGGRRTADVVLELIRKMIPLFKRHLFFSFFWIVTLTHDYLNMPMLLDSDITKLFQAFYDEGIFNNTVIFLMSDHGLRWGSFRETYQGMMEERQPLLIALYPKWMREKYPLAIANLENNTKRLTTHYDLHATMVDLTDLRNIETAQLLARANELQEAETLPRGISLFLPIPITRSCELAGIASHWCTCHQKQELQTNDPRVQRAARYIVKLINDKLKSHPQCRMLYLNSISEAIIAASHHKMLKEVTSDYGIDITVRVQTKPGLGEFESTVRMTTYSTALTGTISRINLYASQSYCIDDYALKMFCYCHR